MKILKICLVILCLLPVRAVGLPRFSGANFFMERWVKISGHPDYMISSLGKILSISRSVNYIDGRIRRYNSKVLKQSYSREYRIISIRQNRINKTYHVHLLVWDHFGDCKRDGHVLTVDHIDGDKENNAIDNLQLLSQRDNNAKYFQQNGRNLPTGVSIKRGKYGAWISIKRKSIFLGTFNTSEDAAKAYNLAKQKQQ